MKNRSFMVIPLISTPESLRSLGTVLPDPPLMPLQTLKGLVLVKRREKALCMSSQCVRWLCYRCAVRINQWLLTQTSA
jgi:hypothetical protein